RTLYASEGFAVEGVLPGEFHLDGRYVDDVLMGQSLV
ncbi:GNAT family N-acetyltransferase, partial [Streptomyces albogriseolus]